MLPFSKKHPGFTLSFFQLQFDDFGAYLQVTDNKGKPVTASYLNYGGAVRNVLRVLEQIEEKNSFVINWDRPSDRVYRSEHPYLLEAPMKRRLQEFGYLLTTWWGLWGRRYPFNSRCNWASSSGRKA